MNKSEFIEAVAEDSGLTKADTGRCVEAVISQITQQLKSGEQVVLPGFGTFSTSYRAAREGRNPKTGETIQIQAARVAKFKAGKGLKDEIQQG